jgi:hypothetical protein
MHTSTVPDKHQPCQTIVEDLDIVGARVPKLCSGFIPWCGGWERAFMEKRERACDEEVLLMGSAPEVEQISGRESRTS